MNRLAEQTITAIATLTAGCGGAVEVVIDGETCVAVLTCDEAELYARDLLECAALARQMSADLAVGRAARERDARSSPTVQARACPECTTGKAYWIGEDKACVVCRGTKIVTTGDGGGGK